MNRRFALSPTKSPALTGGDDHLLGRCLEDPAPFDVLHVETRGPAFRVARDAARRVCGVALNDRGELVTTPDTCPLFTTCVVGSDEPWALAVLGEKNPTVIRETCGTLGGYTSHRYRNEQPCSACNKANARRTSSRKEVAA